MPKRLPLSKGRYALVDDADFDTLTQFRWHITGAGYAAGFVRVNGTRLRVYLHRYLLDAQPGQIVDHIDGDPLNNTRANLRLVTRAQNQWNRKAQQNASGYKGVSWHRLNRKYYARIQVHNRRYFLGYFETAQEAADAYDAAAQQLHGEHARDNSALTRNIVPERSGDPSQDNLATRDAPQRLKTGPRNDDSSNTIQDTETGQNA